MKTLPGYCVFLGAPQNLLKFERLDIAVKWRYFYYLYYGLDHDAERIYKWHIEKRTNGKEPRSWKQSIEDYVSSCKELLKNMKEEGFNPDWPIEYGKNGRLRDGAHRIACALLLGLNVYFKIVPLDGTARWSEKWFLRYKIDPKELIKIKLIWHWLKQ